MRSNAARRQETADGIIAEKGLITRSGAMRCPVAILIGKKIYTKIYTIRKNKKAPESVFEGFSIGEI